MSTGEKASQLNAVNDDTSLRLFVTTKFSFVLPGICCLTRSNQFSFFERSNNVSELIIMENLENDCGF